MVVFIMILMTSLFGQFSQKPSISGQILLIPTKDLGSTQYCGEFESEGPRALSFNIQHRVKDKNTSLFWTNWRSYTFLCRRSLNVPRRSIKYHPLFTVNGQPVKGEKKDKLRIGIG